MQIAVYETKAYTGDAARLYVLPSLDGSARKVFLFSGVREAPNSELHVDFRGLQGEGYLEPFLKKLEELGYTLQLLEEAPIIENVFMNRKDDMAHVHMVFKGGFYAVLNIWHLSTTNPDYALYEHAGATTLKKAVNAFIEDITKIDDPRYEGQGGKLQSLFRTL